MNKVITLLIITQILFITSGVAHAQDVEKAVIGPKMISSKSGKSSVRMVFIDGVVYGKFKFESDNPKIEPDYLTLTYDDSGRGIVLEKVFLSQSKGKYLSFPKGHDKSVQKNDFEFRATKNLFNSIKGMNLVFKTK